MPARTAKDVEAGEKTPLVPAKTRILTKLGSSKYSSKIGGYAHPDTPVGGHPGNPGFYLNLQLALRLTVLAMFLGSMVWMPEVAAKFGLTRFAKHASLAACLMIFMSAPTVGGVINGASAGVTGCFMACLNIFILRGFFPDGVTPGTPAGFASVEQVIGWIDLGFFNLYMLSGNFRMGFRITGMALNTGFMLCFLNPLDQTVFSKNFVINPNGAAVSAFIGTCFGSLCAVLAVLLPYPLGFSTGKMKEGGLTASEDVCKMYMAAVDYFKGKDHSIMIDRQMAQAKILKAEIDGLGGNIGDAYVESFDSSTQGTIRALYSKHSSVLGEMYEYLDAMQVGMSSEDFGPSHVECMDAIGDACVDLVDETSMLLVAATKASEDGDIEESEGDDLLIKEDAVTKAMAKLSKQFDDVRKKTGKSVSRELLNESFFVFCLCAFARLTVSYSKVLRTDPPQGAAFVPELIATIKSVFNPPDVYHFRVCSRYWLSLMVCFLFAVFIDNFSPACAITAVFLINTRIGPDVMAMIQGLLSVVVGVVMNALMYSFSCKYGNTYVLMTISFFYWWVTIFIAKGGSSLAGVGLMMAALAPFAIIVKCPDAITPEMDAARAVGLWGSIRALLIAVVLTVISEIAHIPGRFTSMTTEAVEKAFDGLAKALSNVFDEKDIDEQLGEIASSLADAESFNQASIMEPRLWMAPWKKDFLLETTGSLRKVRGDLFIIRKALLGDNGECSGGIFKVLNRIEESRQMRMDLDQTITDAKELSTALLRHTNGNFTGLTHLDTIYGIDELDGLDTALDGLQEHMEFPKEAPATMESDELVQISIIFVMLEFLIAHISGVIKGAVKLS